VGKSSEANHHPLVLFDLDGTLLDSQSGILYSFRETLRELGRDESDDNLRQLIGPPLGESFARLGVGDDDLDAVVRRYREHYDRRGADMSQPYAGIRELLEQLDAEHVTMAVATSKRVDFALRMLQGHHLDQHFVTICGASLDNQVTTKIDIVDLALVELGSRSVGAQFMVGDRREDMAAAVQHSLRPVGALWGYGSVDELFGGGAFHVLTEPGELLGLVV
jgi:phosphoglycolate phosphatase